MICGQNILVLKITRIRLRVNVSVKIRATAFRFLLIELEIYRPRVGTWRCHGDICMGTYSDKDLVA